MNAFASARRLMVKENDLRVSADNGASDGLVRAIRKALNGRDGPQP